MGVKSAGGFLSKVFGAQTPDLFSLPLQCYFLKNIVGGRAVCLPGFDSSYKNTNTYLIYLLHGYTRKMIEIFILPFDDGEFANQNSCGYIFGKDLEQRGLRFTPCVYRSLINAENNALCLMWIPSSSKRVSFAGI